MGDLRDAAERIGHAVSVQLRRVPRTRLQALARRKGSRVAGQIRSSDETVWLDPRDRMPVRERDLRGRAVELARAEAAAPSPAGEDIDRGAVKNTAMANG